MDKIFALLVLLANVLVLKCQEEELIEENDEFDTSTGNPNYSFSYGVSDVRTGDMKAVWEAKEGDTVTGHYSILEPDGTTRTVDYSASPNTGFTAVVNNDGEQVEPIVQDTIERKVQKEYGKYFDFSEDAEEDYFPTSERKRHKHPFDTVFKDYSAKKRPKYPADLEPSDFSHSITIKHPTDNTAAESGAHSHSHFGIDVDPNCKNKHKKGANSNLYTNVVEFTPPKHPLFSPDSFNEEFEKFEASNYDFEKINPYAGGRPPKISPSDIDFDKFPGFYGSSGKYPKFDDYNFRPSKYPFVPDMPPAENLFPDDLPLRPKKKRRPYKKPPFSPDVHYPVEDLDDYLWVPKKKKKNPPRFDPSAYLPDNDDEYDHPRYPSDFDDDDRPHREPPRGTGAKKEIVKKIVKKRKPGFNLLDILDI